MDDYIDVAARLVEAREKYPEGSLQPANPDKPFELLPVGQDMFVVYGAAFYRTPNDLRPGIGYAWEPVPGRTPYTKNSELMNAETSAWGRAIVAALTADTKRGIASAQEVRNRQAERADDGVNRNKDGTPSKRNNPPEVLDAVGLMHGDKQREHNQLVRDVTATEAKADRTPVDRDTPDQFTDMGVWVEDWSALVKDASTDEEMQQLRARMMAAKPHIEDIVYQACVASWQRRHVVLAQDQQ